MVGDIILTSFISVIVITILHYLYEYFKNILTVPKVKDLVYSPASQYREIYNTIEREQPRLKEKTSEEKPETDMKDELKNYLNSISSKEGIQSRSVSPVSAVTIQSGNQTPWEGQSIGQMDENDSLPTFVDMS
jgi:predicted RND superfamily exporter protein